MSRIIAGEFTTQAEGQETRAALLAAGFEANDLTVFFDNAPGQHGDLPTGGDEYADPEARDAGKGAATGAAIGAGVGWPDWRQAPPAWSSPAWRPMWVRWPALPTPCRTKRVAANAARRA